jgi:hypothetical protein
MREDPDGAPKSSGSFSGLNKWRLDRALAHLEQPTEMKGGNGEKAVVTEPAFSRELLDWPR